jgi:hypothetical protein
MSDDLPPAEEVDGALHFERDRAVKQLEVQHVTLEVVKMALEENRPLEALRQVNDAVNELDEALEWHEDMEAAREGDSATND